MASLRIQAEHRSGVCVLRMTGELDRVVAEELAEHVDRMTRAVPGPVVMNLSGLTYIDARGARALAAVAQNLLAGRQVVLCSCPPHVRLTLDVLGLSLNYLPADFLPAEDWAAAQCGTRDLVNRVQDARLHAWMAKLQAKGVLATSMDVSIRLANTRERTELIREQGQRTLTSARAARDHVTRSRRATA